MKNFKINKIKEQRLIGSKFRQYIDFVILACCFIIAINIHPSSIANNSNISEEKTKMVYIFHDYKGNEYIMNDKVHGVSTSRDYLFDDEVPIDLRGDEDEPISIGSLLEEYNSQTGYSDLQTGDSVKNNQVPINDIMSILGVSDDGEIDSLVINIGDNEDLFDDNTYYTVKGLTGSNELIIEVINSGATIETVGDEGDTSPIINEGNNENEVPQDNTQLIGKTFTFVEEGRILPTLVSRNDLYFNDESHVLSYNTGHITNNGDSKDNTDNKKGGITIIDDYDSCTTPRGYKIAHGDSVLAYQQMDEAPNICNIERRFCWKGKLSGSYSQQGCSINKNYTYEEWGNAEILSNTDKNEIKGGTRQNSDGSVSVKNSEIGGSFVFERPNRTYTDFSNSYNIRPEEPEVQQQTRPYWGCTTPRGEKLKHGEFVQAFKHSNGFSDAPCEAQIRLCTMGELMGTFTESRCQTRDTSFIDWINGSTSRKTYSKEKIDLIKKQIKADNVYYRDSRKDADRSTDSSSLDRILYILDQD